MSQVMQFLEALGGGRGPAPAEFAASVARLDAPADLKQALLDRNREALRDLLDGRARMMCMIFTPDEPRREDEEQPDGVPDQTPDEDE